MIDFLQAYLAQLAAGGAGAIALVGAALVVVALAIVWRGFRS